MICIFLFYLFVYVVNVHFARLPSLLLLQGDPLHYTMCSQITTLNLTRLILFKSVPVLLELLLYFGYPIYIYAIMSDMFASLIT